MQEIGNRLILWISCLVLSIIAFGISTKVVIAVLFALTLSCLGLYIRSSIQRLLIITLYVMGTLYFIEFIIFIPIIMYEWLCLIWTIFYEIYNEETFKDNLQTENNQKNFDNKKLFYFVPVIMLFISAVNNLSKLNIIYINSILILFFIAIWLNFVSHKFTELKQRLIKTRDSSVELTIALKNKNKYIMEKQDYEIYLATLRERNRIAREIHDNVGHMLSRSILQMGAVLTINKDDELKPFLIGVKETLDLAMNSIRTSVHDLHDEAIDLKEAVNDIVNKDLKKFNVNMDFDMSENIPKHIKYCFISVVKEAISNINKYSNGDKVYLSFMEHPAFFRLEIDDNGTLSSNMRTMEFEHNGIGLSNIKERVENVNGTFNISNSNGFKLVISVPKK